METTTDLNPLHYIVWDNCNNFFVKEDVNHLRTQRSSECYLRQMAWWWGWWWWRTN